MDIICKVHRTQGPGHVLAFFTGQNEIERAGRLLSDAVAQEKVDNRAMGVDGEVGNGLSELLVVPLFGALSAEAQAAAFKPARAGVRKVTIEWHRWIAFFFFLSQVWFVDGGYAVRFVLSAAVSVTFVGF